MLHPLVLAKVTERRRELCAADGCAADFENICAACPNGHWSAFEPEKFCDQIPSFRTMARSAAGALGSVIRHGAKPVSHEEQARRLEICHGCEFFLRDKNRCGKCGCFLAFKTKLAAWHCPVGKW